MLRAGTTCAEAITFLDNNLVAGTLVDEIDTKSYQTGDKKISRRARGVFRLLESVLEAGPEKATRTTGPSCSSRPMSLGTPPSRAGRRVGGLGTASAPGRRSGGGGRRQP
jgi:hypothetical protein